MGVQQIGGNTCPHSSCTHHPPSPVRGEGVGLSRGEPDLHLTCVVPRKSVNPLSYLVFPSETDTTGLWSKDVKFSAQTQAE